jgi:hypothetical protein
MRRSLLASLCLASTSLSLLLAGCSGGDGDGLTTDAALPVTTGSYNGTYRVPTSPDLAAAASFSVESIDWEVEGSQVTLHYNLPEGLVGGRLGVTLRGTIAPGAKDVTLTSAQGTGRCVATATTITCREEFADLGILPISAEVVTEVAMKEFAGPVALRTNVSTVFSSDPIGFVELDLTMPVSEDHGAH